MFDLRLGLALGKTLEEIRSLSYVEWKLWLTFSRIEPFGWWEHEERQARDLAMLHNSRVSKRKDVKLPKDFIRGDLPEQIIEELSRTANGVSAPLAREDMSAADIDALKAAIAKDFGI